MLNFIKIWKKSKDHNPDRDTNGVWQDFQAIQTI